MITPKAHLKSAYRSKPPKVSRAGYLRLDMNESVSGLPAGFIRQAFSKIGPGLLSMYPEYERLIKKIASCNRLCPENICLSNGSDAAIKYIFDAYIRAGDKVLLTDPTFAMYPVYCAIFGAHAVNVEYGPDLAFPEKEFIKHLRAGIRMAVIVNPNNPAGTVLEKNALERIINIAASERVLLVIDEAYYYFYPRTVIGLVNRYHNLVVLRSFSKLCGLAGARLGFAAACPEIVANLNKVRPSFDVNAIAVFLGQRLLGRSSVIREILRQINSGRDYLSGKLSAAGITYKQGRANFLLINCGRQANKIRNCLKKEKILVAGGFRQECLKDYLRVTLADKPVMQRFWKAFQKVRKARFA